MNPNTRLSPVNTTLDVPRQTPKGGFGEVMASTINGVIRTGTAIASAVPGMPVLSTAVGAVTSLAEGIVPLPMQAASRSATISSSQRLVASDESAELSGALSQMRQQSSEYLAMQNAMQQESREYNALSNIIKVRHDSAKAAINNIR